MLLYEDQFRKVAGFLFVDERQSDGSLVQRPVGTVVFLHVPILKLSGTVWHLTYAVTTRHTLIAVERTMACSNLRIRVNNREAPQYVDYPAPPEKWFRHPTDDVALVPFISQEPTDMEVLGLEDLVQEADLKRAGGNDPRYLPGDDVMTVGLYAQHAGFEQIDPILRFGHVSLVPREPVRMRIEPSPAPVAWREAFLIEAQAWRGQSGSPVFVYEDDERPGPLSMKMLGLVQGYTNEQVSEGAWLQWVNAGIAMVVPAYKIPELLMMEDVVKDREQKAEAIRNREPDGTVSASGVVDDDEFARFESLTRNLLAVPKAELDEERGQTN